MDKDIEKIIIDVVIGMVLFTILNMLFKIIVFLLHKLFTFFSLSTHR